MNYIDMLDSSVSGFARIRFWMGWLYWLLVLFTFVALRYADPGWDEGGIPLVLLGLPWSLAIILLVGGLSTLVPAADQTIPFEAMNFLLFVIVCGGLNAALLIGIRKVFLWFTAARYRLVELVALVILLTGAAQVIMPRIDQNALERSRPSNGKISEFIHPSQR